jgi:gamma-glutamyltranspeptidase/glutathione hydrolase
VLRAGGSAADAAVAANAVLAVTTQQSCGMGGDLVALVHPPTEGRRALLAVGSSRLRQRRDRLRARGHTRMPFRGRRPDRDRPGLRRRLAGAARAYGRLPLERVLSAAIGYALDGFPVSPAAGRALPLVADVEGGEELVGTHAAGARRPAPPALARPGAAGRSRAAAEAPGTRATSGAG